jgi:D-alanyl-D-alanine carboxypeptidase
MTAIVALENAVPDQVFTVAAEHTRIEGSSMYLREGEQYTLIELLYGMLLTSGNDAADVIADGVFMSEEEFVNKMNETAIKLGMLNTNFTNPTGLPNIQSYSTAHDMAILMAYAMQNETFAKICGTREHIIGTRTVVNHNKLLWMCEGVDGGKTGYTESAGRCLVTTALKNGRRLVAVTLNDARDWDDHIKLYKYGFSLYTERTIAPADILTGVSLNIVGSDLSSTPVYLAKPLSIYLRPSETYEVIIYLPRFEYAPIGKNQQVGYIVLIRGGREIAREALYSMFGADYKQ